MSTAKYIALEGVEGCGKSTHVTRLAESLGALATREPGGTVIGSTLRGIMADTNNSHLSARAEALMMAADRAQHVAEVVRPALAAGRHVVSDRSVYSSLAYQGHGRGLGEAEVRRINDWALDGTWPDLVVLIDVPMELLAERMKKRDLDRFEREDRAFFGRVLAGFRSMAAAEPGRFAVVDGTPPKDELQATILATVRERMGIA
jgi:dTMP kinase